MLVTHGAEKVGDVDLADVLLQACLPDQQGQPPQRVSASSGVGIRFSHESVAPMTMTQSRKAINNSPSTCGLLGIAIIKAWTLSPPSRPFNA